MFLFLKLIKKCTLLKNAIHFLSLKGFHAPEKVCSPSRDHQTLQSKREISIFFFPFWDHTGLPDLVKPGSNPDTDPQHCFFENSVGWVTLFATVGTYISIFFNFHF
jgi:hypothetical protein